MQYPWGSMPIGAMRGAPAALAFDTTRSVVETWPEVYETQDFVGKTDGAEGEITIPETGSYLVGFNLTGVLTGGVADGEGIAYLRSSTAGDLPLQAGPVVLGTLRAGFSFTTWGQFSADEVLSVALDATADLGTVTFTSGSFMVALLAKDLG